VLWKLFRLLQTFWTCNFWRNSATIDCWCWDEICFLQL